MPSWDHALSALNSAVITSLGGIPVTFTPQDGSGNQAISGLIQTPSMAEDYIPGSVQGVNRIRLFVRFSVLSPLPKKGDSLTVNGISYFIDGDPLVDSQGGAILILTAT